MIKFNRCTNVGVDDLNFCNRTDMSISRAHFGNNMAYPTILPENWTA
jgi:hypothetical protein